MKQTFENALFLALVKYGYITPVYPPKMKTDYRKKIIRDKWEFALLIFLATKHKN